MRAPLRVRVACSSRALAASKAASALWRRTASSITSRSGTCAASSAASAAMARTSRGREARWELASIADTFSTP